MKYSEIIILQEKSLENSSKNDEDYISMQHEYILCYVKDKEQNKGEWYEQKQGTDEIFAAFDEFKKNMAIIGKLYTKKL